MHTRKAILYGAASLAALLAPSLARGQQPSGPAGPVPSSEVTPEPPTPAPLNAEVAPDEIIVTARRRDESIVDVPLAISVVTSEQLRKLGLRDTAQIANFTPGLQFSDFTPGDSRNDRGRARPLIFRGINVGQGGSVTAAGGMFLDGAAVVGNEIPAGMDIGAVEVLRGPQSVYFGRSTMTGAVSYRTKAIPDEWVLEVELSAAQRDAYRFEASVAGPLIADLLKVRLTGLYEDSDGYVTNDYDPRGEKLGARSRSSISGTADLTPLDGLTFKAYVNYFRDEDGPAQTAFVPAPLASNCIIPTAPGFETLRTQLRPTVCGKAPGRRLAINYLNTDLPPVFADLLFRSPLIKGAGIDREVGLQREAFNFHLVANWELSEYMRLQSVTGYHTNVTITVQDGIGQPIRPTFPYSAYFYSLSNKTYDLSQELRLSSDPERKFSWTLGFNYIDAYDQVQAYVGFQDQVNGVNTTFRAFPQSLGTNAAKTYGFFGGGYLKLFDERLTVSAEGRYQIDDRNQRQQNGTTFVETVNLSEKFRSFNPRLSLDYDVGGNRKLYASYATGTRPGGFNTLLLTYFNAPNPDPVVIQQIIDLLGVTNATIEEEKLKIGELGFKGRFGDGRGYFDINAYYGILSNQQVLQGALIPALGFTVTATTNIGETEVYGIEWQGSFNFTRELSLATTFAWNHAERTVFINQGGINQFGTNDLSGVKSAFVPEFTGSAVLSWTRPLTGDWEFFSNSAYVYRGKQFTDVGNLSFIKGRHQVDLRLGVSNDRLTVEAFLLNVFNDRSYTGGNVQADFGQIALTQLYHAFFGAVAPPRQFGVRFLGRF
jgi:iron complex outermembrane receptor protein